MANIATIYILCDSRESDPIRRVRYVGRTVWPLPRRLAAHRYAATHGGVTRNACWMRSVYDGGGEIEIEAIQRVSLSQVDSAEIGAIATYRSLGCRLNNHTDGGGGILRADDATRVKIGAAARGNTYWLGRKHRPESVAKMAAGHRGRPMHPNTRASLERPEVRAKITAKLRVRILSPEELAIKREHARRVLHTPGARAKRRAAISTAEHRARLSARHRTPLSLERARQLGFRNKGRKMSAAWCAQRAAHARLQRHSAETKSKMSLWQRGGDSHRAKLTWEDVKTIRTRYANGGLSQHQLAHEYDVQPRTINLIVHNKTWVVAA